MLGKPETESYVMDFPSGKTKTFEVDRCARDRETFAMYWLKKKGYDAYQCQTSAVNKFVQKVEFKGYSEQIRKLKKIESLHTLLGVGCPDIVAFNDAGLIFVEVKSMKDGLRKTRLEWMIEHQDNFSIKIMYLE